MEITKKEIEVIKALIDTANVIKTKETMKKALIGIDIIISHVEKGKKIEVENDN